MSDCVSYAGFYSWLRVLQEAIARLIDMLQLGYDNLWPAFPALTQTFESRESSCFWIVYQIKHLLDISFPSFLFQCVRNVISPREEVQLQSPIPPRLQVVKWSWNSHSSCLWERLLKCWKQVQCKIFEKQWTTFVKKEGWSDLQEIKLAKSAWIATEVEFGGF